MRVPEVLPVGDVTVSDGLARRCLAGPGPRDRGISGAVIQACVVAVVGHRERVEERGRARELELVDEAAVGAGHLLGPVYGAGDVEGRIGSVEVRRSARAGDGLGLGQRSVGARQPGARDRVDLAGVVVDAVDRHSSGLDGVVVGRHRARVVVPGRVQPVGRDRVDPNVVGVGIRVPVVGLDLGDVRTGVSAPDLADRSDRADPPAEQRRVGFPVDLLVLEADQGDAGVRALLEGPSLPPADQVRAVVPGGPGPGDLHGADHPAAAGVHLVGRGRDRHRVDREAVAAPRRHRRLVVALARDRRVAADVRAHPAAQVRSVAGVARAQLLGVALREAVPVDPGVGVRVSRHLHVAVAGVEARSVGLLEQVDVAHRGRVERIDDLDRLRGRMGRRRGQRAGRRGRPARGGPASVTGHEDDLVVVVELRHRIRHRSGVSGGVARARRLLGRVDLLGPGRG